MPIPERCFSLTQALGQVLDNRSHLRVGCLGTTRDHVLHYRIPFLFVHPLAGYDLDRVTSGPACFLYQVALASPAGNTSGAKTPTTGVPRRAAAAAATAFETETGSAFRGTSGRAKGEFSGYC